MNQPTKGTAVRLPLDLHTLITVAAVENNRSRHAEMLHRLDSSFSEPSMMETDEALAVLNKVAENVMTEVLTRLFTGLEDRLAALIAKKMEAAEMSLITEVKFGGNPDDFAAAVRNFDFTTGKRRVSPTGRLSVQQPELQDLPAVSGMSTLAASLRPMHCRAFDGATDLVNFGGFHSGGFTGLPTGEMPPILERGEQVMSLPFADQTWVITGSLETMTRDRAREIIMELGGTVAGSVDERTNVLLWGPGAGSKKERAEGFGIRLRTEHQFIEIIRRHGVDMPLPKAPTQPDAVWIENAGYRPDSLRPDHMIETRTRPHGTTAKRLVGDIPCGWWETGTRQLPVISHWRLAQ